MSELGLNEADSSSYYIAALILFTAMRFVNTALMKVISPGVLLTLSTLLAIIFTATVVFGHGVISVYALVGISGCMSLMFPTIYGLATRGLGQDTKIAASGQIMAIVGGAVFPAIQGLVSDATGSISTSYIVPLVCFLIILFYAGWIGRRLDLKIAVRGMSCLYLTRVIFESIPAGFGDFFPADDIYGRKLSLHHTGLRRKVF
jgi:MFS transporter, FHS family, L-fucose permease